MKSIINAAMLMLLSAPAGLSQVPHPQIKPKSDSPIEVSNARCDADKVRGWQCVADVKFLKPGANGYGLLWTVKYNDGTTAEVRRGATKPNQGDHFAVGEVSTKEAHFGAANQKTGTELVLIDATVEAEFVSNVDGTTWGAKPKIQ